MAWACSRSTAPLPASTALRAVAAGTDHVEVAARLAAGRVEIEPLSWSGSGDLVGFMRATALLVVPEDQAMVREGDLVEAILLPSLLA